MRYYKGRLGVHSIYTECLNSTKVRTYFNPKDIQDFLPENVGSFNIAFAKNPKLIIYEICEDSIRGREHLQKSIETNNRHLWKFLPPDIKLTANDILIYDGKVAIINLRDKNTIDGVVISNPDYYANSVQLFDLLWRLLPENTTP